MLVGCGSSSGPTQAEAAHLLNAGTPAVNAECIMRTGGDGEFDCYADGTRDVSRLKDRRIKVRLTVEDSGTITVDNCEPLSHEFSHGDACSGIG